MECRIKRADQQNQHQQKEGTYSNLGIIAENPTSTELDISVARLVVAVGGKERGYQENTTNMQEGATE